MPAVAAVVDRLGAGVISRKRDERFTHPPFRLDNQGIAGKELAKNMIQSQLVRVQTVPSSSRVVQSGSTSAADLRRCLPNPGRHCRQGCLGSLRAHILQDDKLVSRYLPPRAAMKPGMALVLGKKG